MYIKSLTVRAIQNTSQKSFLWIWSHLLKRSLIENLLFCAVKSTSLRIREEGFQNKSNKN